MCCEQLSERFVEHRPTLQVGGDNGPELTAEAVRTWLRRLEGQTLFIHAGSLSENGYNESFNRMLRDEMLNGELLTTLR